MFPGRPNYEIGSGQNKGPEDRSKRGRKLPNERWRCVGIFGVDCRAAPSLSPAG